MKFDLILLYMSPQTLWLQLAAMFCVSKRFGD